MMIVNKTFFFGGLWVLWKIRNKIEIRKPTRQMYSVVYRRSKTFVVKIRKEPTFV